MILVEICIFYFKKHARCIHEHTYGIYQKYFLFQQMISQNFHNMEARGHLYYNNYLNHCYILIFYGKLTFLCPKKK